MSREFPQLLSPFTIKGVTLRNRVVFLPHSTGFATKDGVPTERMAYYLAERARGGVGLVVTENLAVHATGKSGPTTVDAYRHTVVPGFQRISRRVRKFGAKIFGQLTHCGTTTAQHPPHLLWAPSQIPEPPSHYVPKQMEPEDIKAVIKGFALSSHHLKQGGFDGVEIKAAAHDGLLRLFVSPFLNRRSDEYGGSFENRMRLPIQIIHAIREAVGPAFPLGIRVCLDEFTSWGYAFDYAERIIRCFAATEQVDYVCCDAGIAASGFLQIPVMGIPLGPFVYMSRRVKELTDLPVIAFGRINDPVQAEKILVDGNADLIGMARELICDPEFVNKAKEGRTDDIRHCVACNDGCIYQIRQDKPLRCIQNPAVGREKRYGTGTRKVAVRGKKVVVVGGGPAGLKTAETAVLRNHQVVLLERNDELGGQVNVAARVPYRQELRDIIRYLMIQIEKYEVEVHCGTKATPRMIAEIRPDAVVVATGSIPHIPSIAGVDRKSAISVREVLLERAELGERIVIVDEERCWQGIGTAEFLAERGKKVEVLTSALFVGDQLEATNLSATYRRVLEKGVTFTPHTEVRKVAKNELVVANVHTEEERFIEGVDTVVWSYGSRSDNGLYYSLKGMVDELYAVGDCVAPRMIEQAIYEGDEVGRIL